MIDDVLLNEILNELFQLNAPAINNSRKPQISEFIKSTINGDTPKKDYLVINCNFSKEGKGALIYILTDIRLLKIQIDEKDLSSSKPLLSSIINTNKKIQEGNRTIIEIQFQNDYFGLEYNTDNHKINEFFQKVDLAITQREKRKINEEK